MPEKSHWESVYSSKPSSRVSWYQAHAAVSLKLIKDAVPEPDDSILDIGGGASTLVDDLLLAGYRHVAVLDLSGEALSIARNRLGQKAQTVVWHVGDVTTLALPEAGVDLWHDRAVFHFLVEAAQRRAYIAQALRVVKPGGHLVVATFAPDGPDQCSGLPVQRYSVEELHAEFGPAFELLSHADEHHITPGGNQQHFVYCLFRIPA